MGSIKTTQIDGDISIGRNVALGGSVVAQGHAHIKSGLRVDGWLDAQNIKGANKGLFSSLEELSAALPSPEDGWWAIVGTTLTDPIYVGKGGAWVASGGNGSGQVVDVQRYDSDIEELQSDIGRIGQDIDGIEEDIRTLGSGLSKVTLLQVPSEEAMEEKIASGDYDPEQVYFVAEED